MTLSTSELFIWDHHKVSLPELSLIQVLNIWQLQVFYVMMRLLVTINLKNMIHCQEASLLEIKSIKDVKQWLTICTSLNQIKYCQRHHQNSPMVPLSSKASSGKIIHAFNH